MCDGYYESACHSTVTRCVCVCVCVNTRMLVYVWEPNLSRYEGHTHVHL